MSDFPLSVPNRRGPGRQPQRAECVWTLRKDESVIRAELCSHGSVGVEFQMLKDGAVIYNRWFPSREITLEEAANRRRSFEAEGWTV